MTRRDVSLSLDVLGLQKSLETTKGVAEGVERMFRVSPPAITTAEDVPDLSALAEEFIDDPHAEGKIAKADPEELAQTEAALAQETRALVEELKTLQIQTEELVAEQHQEDGKKRFADFSASLVGLSDEDQAARIRAAFEDPTLKDFPTRAIASEEVGRLIWKDIEPELVKTCDLYTAWQPEAYQTYITLSKTSPFLSELCLRFFENQFGPYFAKKLQDENYIAELSHFAKHLEQTKIQGINLIDPPLALSQVMVVRETFESTERLTGLCDAFDIGKYLPEWDGQTDNGVLDIGYGSFSETSMQGTINIKLKMKKDEMEAEIDRNLSLNVEFDEKDDSQPKKALSVVHIGFKLPDEVQNQGIAKHVLRDSFEWYFEQKKHGCNVAEVELLANISVGGYAWAAYGFGWNKEKMSQGEAELLKGETGKDSQLNHEKLWRAALTRHVQECKKRAEGFLKYVYDLTPDDRGNLLEELDDALLDATDPLTSELVTPQRLACLGKMGRQFVQIQYDEDSVRWYPEPAPVEGKVLQRMHLGKAMSLGLGWHGRLSLEPKTDLERGQLEQLKKRIDL